MDRSSTKQFFILLVFLSASLFNNVWADTFDDASTAYSNGNYKQAMKIWHKLAENGHLQAQFNIAYMYEFGIELKPDYKKAIEWYQKAANNGYARAQNFLGWMYETGKGVERNRDTALIWLKKAANQGSKDAIADHQLVYKRKQRNEAREYKQAMFEALKQQMLNSEARYNNSKAPTRFDAAIKE